MFDGVLEAIARTGKDELMRSLKPPTPTPRKPAADTKASSKSQPQKSKTHLVPILDGQKHGRELAPAQYFR